MRLSQRGFTLTELMIVVAMMSLIMLFSLPRFGGLQEASRLRSARQEVEAAIATARAAAIQKGYDARVHFTSHTIWVDVDTATAGSPITVLAPRPLNQVYGVRLIPSHDPITFDSRGFATGLGGQATLRLQVGSRADSVCLTAMGQIMPRGCSL